MDIITGVVVLTTVIAFCTLGWGIYLHSEKVKKDQRDEERQDVRDAETSDFIAKMMTMAESVTRMANSQLPPISARAGLVNAGVKIRGSLSTGRTEEEVRKALEEYGPKLADQVSKIDELSTNLLSPDNEEKEKTWAQISAVSSSISEDLKGLDQYFSPEAAAVIVNMPIDGGTY